MELGLRGSCYRIDLLGFAELLPVADEPRIAVGGVPNKPDKPDRGSRFGLA
jgi:hypothetical protein